MAVVIARFGDEYPVTFTTNVDLTGATSVQLVARLEGVGAPVLLPSTVAGMVVTHTLTGTLPVGRYRVEVQAGWISGGLVTFPTSVDGAYLEILDPALPIPFVYPANLSAYTAGLVAESDPRSALILAGATEAVQRYCGWHIAPARDVTVTLDGGSSVLYLPTLKLNSVASVVVDGVTMLAEDYEWSRATGNLRSKLYGGFPDSWGGVVVTFNSGFSTVPADVQQVVLQMSAMALSSPTGATREQAGQVSMQWATTAAGVAGGMSLLTRDLAVLDQYKLAREI